MNEKLQYASMLEIPVNTCNVTSAPAKRKKRKKPTPHNEDIKQELLNKVNLAQEMDNQIADQIDSVANANENAVLDKQVENSAIIKVADEKSVKPRKKEDKVFQDKSTAVPKRKIAFTAVTVELVIVGALLAVIFLTNAFYPSSGINSFVNKVFGSSNAVETIDTRNYAEFSPVLAIGNQENTAIADGIMTITATGSVYAPCNGTVSAVSLDGNGRYTLEISHSQNFVSRISGLDYAYAEKGDTVFGNIPVGYVLSNGITMCFTGAEGKIITDYQVAGNSVVWEV